MHGVDIRAFPERDFALMIPSEQRLSRPEQISALFMALDAALAKGKVGRGVVSLDPLSFARDDELCRCLAGELRARKARGAHALFWTGGLRGEAAFMRRAAALARVAPLIFPTEYEALERLLDLPAER